MFASIYLLLVIMGVDATFVERGNYSDLEKFGVNLDNCGLQHLIYTQVINFSGQCFQKDYPVIAVQTVQIPRRAHYFVSSVGPRTRGMGVSTRDGIIHLGRDSSPGESPWTVRITFEKIDNICTGALIANEWVVTTADCIYNKRTQDIKVSGGFHDVKQMKTTIIAKRSIIHPNYVTSVTHRTDHEFDIALIKLEEKFNETVDEKGRYLVNTICLPKGFKSYEDMPKSGMEQGLMASFGVKNLLDPYSHPDILQVGNRSLVFEDCWPKLVCIDFNVNPALASNVSRNSRKICKADTGVPLYQFPFMGEGISRPAVLEAIHIGDDHICDKIYGKNKFEEYYLFVGPHINWIINEIKNPNNY